MFSKEDSITGKMNIEIVWDLYSNLSRWHEWGAEMERVELDGAFISGATGTLFMKDMPPMPFRLDNVVENCSFDEILTAGGMTMIFGHTITDEGNGKYTLQHTLVIIGPDEVTIQQVGHTIASDLPVSLQKIYNLSRVGYGGSLYGER